MACVSRFPSSDWKDELGTNVRNVFKYAGIIASL